MCPMRFWLRFSARDSSLKNQRHFQIRKRQCSGWICSRKLRVFFLFHRMSSKLSRENEFDCRETITTWPRTRCLSGIPYLGWWVCSEKSKNIDIIRPPWPHPHLTHTHTPLTHIHTPHLRRIARFPGPFGLRTWGFHKHVMTTKWFLEDWPFVRLCHILFHCRD